MENFNIVENVAVEHPPIAERVGNTLGHLAGQAMRATYEASKQVLGDMVTSVALDITDAREGSQLRKEWCAKRREARIAKMALLV